MANKVQKILARVTRSAAVSMSVEVRCLDCGYRDETDGATSPRTNIEEPGQQWRRCQQRGREHTAETGHKVETITIEYRRYEPT